ncbi:MAG TPA: tetratricopeptide repeat protein [Thermoanaerobaculia bacterium]|nr:tetratricopeptide repeat protein [Thermoanaerobaculia bacterium]
MRRSLALSIVLILLTAGAVFAGTEARISGKIIDAATKKPIENASVNVFSTEKRNFNQDFKAKKDGTYAIFLLDATVRYKFTFSAPGYAPFSQTIKLDIGIPNTKNVELTSASAAQQAGTGEVAQPKEDPAVVAYNEGATLANEGKYAEAAEKFEAALAAKPDMAAATRALAKVSLASKNYAKAIERANKALMADNEDTDMYVVLFESYTATGDKTKAAEVKAKIPMNPGELFNDAAKLINAGKDSEAEKLLKQAISADDKFGIAYYELGMIYVRGGKNADARTNLQKYLELEPNGKDAATAKEMLKYVK